MNPSWPPLLLPPPSRFLPIKIISPSWYESVCYNLGLRSYFELLCYILDEFTFDLRYGVSTSGIIRPTRLSYKDSLVQAQATRYRATPPHCVRMGIRLLDKYIKSFDAISFVDYGCGKGRVMLIALEACFKQVIGLELSPSLIIQCRENLNKHSLRHDCHSRFLVLEQDAATYSPPPDACVFYLFNPFRPVIFEQVMKQIANSILKNPRSVYILTLQSGYNFQPTGFRLVDQTTGVSIFTNTPRPSSAAHPTPRSASS